MAKDLPIAAARSSLSRTASKVRPNVECDRNRRGSRRARCEVHRRDDRIRRRNCERLEHRSARPEHALRTAGDAQSERQRHGDGIGWRAVLPPPTRAVHRWRAHVGTHHAADVRVSEQRRQVKRPPGRFFFLLVFTKCALPPAVLPLIPRGAASQTKAERKDGGAQKSRARSG